ncbi:hypothetical protein E3Z27_20380 [Pseudomonas mediterranea]|uniref:hypothetical protein n=1 Tax=Pseudomonas mediterranea TaxID=183795 RepID=UPI000AD37AE8|nr:hypothetical protein [Pseudomonas mediterranea]QHA83855.1 hypothetical protein E3Z27_20380 [Pseudomonas mediterranea]
MGWDSAASVCLPGETDAWPAPSILMGLAGELSGVVSRLVGDVSEDEVETLERVFFLGLIGISALEYK